MPRQTINAPGAAAVGPYSHAVRTGNLLFLSGQTPIDPATGKLAQGDIGSQTSQCLDNLLAVLRAANLTLDDVVKTTVFLVDMADFAAMNEAYKTRFQAPFPARSTIGVAALPLGARVEIELVAQLPE